MAKDLVKIGQLRAALQREVSKLTRQRAAIGVMESMIQVIQSQIDSEESRK